MGSMRSAYMIHAKEFYNGSVHAAKAENPVAPWSMSPEVTVGTV